MKAKWNPEASSEFNKCPSTHAPRAARNIWKVVTLPGLVGPARASPALRYSVGVLGAAHTFEIVAASKQSRCSFLSEE